MTTAARTDDTATAAEQNGRQLATPRTAQIVSVSAATDVLAVGWHTPISGDAFAIARQGQAR